MALPAKPIPRPPRPIARDGTLRYDWDNQDSTVTSFTLSLIGPSTTTVTIGADARNYTFAGLSNGTTYILSMYSTNSNGNSEAAIFDAAQPGTIPGEPRNVQVTKVGTNSLSLTWDAPLSTGGSEIQWYALLDSRRITGDVRIGIEPWKRSHITQPIANGTYTFNFCAVNSVGYGTAVPAGTFTLSTIPSGNTNMIILGDSSVTTVKTNLTSIKSTMGYGGTLTITTQQLNGYDGSDLSSYDLVLLYTNGGLNLNATLGDNLDSFVASGKHLIMMSFSWGNVARITNFDYANNSTYAYKGSYTSVNTNALTYDITHPITTGVTATLGTATQDVPSPITLTSDAIQIAKYSNDTSAIAVKTIGSSRLVGFNSYPYMGSNQNRLLLNAIYWCMGYLS